MIEAVPADVNWAVPMIAELLQYVADALQKITRPFVTAEPFDTAAVKVTAVPRVTVEADKVSVVVVAPACAIATMIQTEVTRTSTPPPYFAIAVRFNTS